MTDTIDMLLNAAENGIRQKGYNAVSFRELADDLGIKSASVHYYFRKKEDLGLALVERYSANFFRQLDALADKQSSPENKFKAFCEAYKEALVSSDAICLCGILGAESSGLPEPLSQSVSDFFRANMNWLENVLPDDWTPALRQSRASQIVATLQGAMMLSKSLNDPKLFDRAVENLHRDMFTS